MADLILSHSLACAPLIMPTLSRHDVTSVPGSRKEAGTAEVDNETRPVV
jgi:hypothetical protein